MRDEEPDPYDPSIAERFNLGIAREALKEARRILAEAQRERANK